MKNIGFVIFMYLLIPFLLWGQSIDTSKYQEVTIKDAHEIRKSSPGQTLYFKSIGHFSFEHYNNVMYHHQTAWYHDGNYVGGNYYSRDLLNRIRLSQVAVIYYRFRIDSTGGFYTDLDYFEVLDIFFIIGTRYVTKENLRLRDEGSLSGGIIKTIRKDRVVIVLEEGKLDTIDGILSAWVKIRLSDNTEGWCFGGYLGYLSQY